MKKYKNVLTKCSHKKFKFLHKNSYKFFSPQKLLKTLAWEKPGASRLKLRK